MTVTDTVEVSWNGDGPPPIYDSDHLRRRIAALGPDDQATLHEAWVANGLGSLTPLMTAEAYAVAERLVSNREPGAVGSEAWARLNAVADALYALPEHIYRNACEALKVYAGIDNPRAITVSTLPRIAEAERIIAEAVAYAAELEANPPPRVDDLPPVDDTQEQVAAEDYPGPKAGVPIVKAWVDAAINETTQLNRAARAYAQEQDRSSPRKGLTQWLEAKLGPDGVAKVQQAIAAASPPPLDLGAGTAAGAEGGTAGPGVHDTLAASVGETTAPNVEAEPAVPTFSPSEQQRQVLHRIAILHHQMSQAYTELAEVS